MLVIEKLLFQCSVRGNTKPGSISLPCTYNRRPYSGIISGAHTDTRHCGEMYLTQIELKEITLTVKSCLNMFRHTHAQSAVPTESTLQTAAGQHGCQFGTAVSLSEWRIT